MNFTGRTALITGAAGGIGGAITRRLAADGADLVLWDLGERVEETATAAREMGVTVRTARVDVADGAAVDAAMPDDIDILVNNAGVVKNIAPLARMPHDAWATEIGVNLSGPFNCTRAAVTGMAARGWGRIVNISSVAARGGMHNQAGYSASKTGLLGLTHSVVLEYARHGITCNAVLPGVIETETVLGMPAEILESARTLAPARRGGSVDEVAHLVAFLASDEAGFINGAEVDIDGGLRLNALTLSSGRELRERFRQGEPDR